MPDLHLVDGPGYGSEPNPPQVRVQMLGMLHGQPISLDLPGCLLRLDGAGFSFRGPFEIPEDAVHRFRFQLRSDAPVVAQARCIGTVSTRVDGDLRFISEFAWTVEEPVPDRASLVALLREVARQGCAPAEDVPFRVWPRLQLFADLPGHQPLAPDQIELRGFELGGIVVDTATPIEVGTEAFLRFDANDSLGLTLRVRAIADRPVRPLDLQPVYRSLLQFIDSKGQGAPGVARLFERLAKPGLDSDLVDIRGRRLDDPADGRGHRGPG